MYQNWEVELWDTKSHSISRMPCINALTKLPKNKGQLENILVDVLNAHWFSTDGLLTDAEKRAAVTSSIESTNWWDVEGDKEWDEWTL